MTRAITTQMPEKVENQETISSLIEENNNLSLEIMEKIELQKQLMKELMDTIEHANKVLPFSEEEKEFYKLT